MDNDEKIYIADRDNGEGSGWSLIIHSIRAICTQTPNIAAIMGCRYAAGWRGTGRVIIIFKNIYICANSVYIMYLVV